MTLGILAAKYMLNVVNFRHQGVKLRMPSFMILHNYGLCPSSEVKKLRYAAA
jgi:hypothetical protein